MGFKALRQWRRRSLANSFALHAVLIAAGSSLMVGLVSLGVIFWVEQATLQKNLQEKAGRSAERIEGAIRVVESAVFDLSKNPMFMTALLDSPGRNSYVIPFLENYTFPVMASSGLALCDINGQLLTGTRSALSGCRAHSPLFQQVIATGKIFRELIPLTNGHYSWVIYKGVVFPYTGTVEGVVVTQLDLNEVLHDIPRDLDLETVELVRANSAESLSRAAAEGIKESSRGESRALLFKGKTDAVPFPIEVIVKDHLSPFESKLTPLVLSYVLGGVLLILLVVYWARRASQQLIAPLKELTDIAHTIAQSGELSVTVPKMDDGEVGRLANAFEVMVSTLRASEATLEGKVAQRTEALKQSELAAESANIAKSRFLATMSHEIRTPMNGILGMAQILLMPDINAAEREDYARTILTSGQTLLVLLNDILDLSKVEAGKLQLESVRLAPEQIIRETRALLADSAGCKALRLEIDWSGPTGQHYLGDPHRLRQMLANLVSNAIKFTEKGEIRIEGREMARDGHFAMLEFAVSDTGVGIPADKQSQLFAPFSQTDSSTTRQYGGSGLGLSIVRNLARLMGGDADVKSEAGRGSRFCFQIRAALVAVDDEGEKKYPHNKKHPPGEATTQFIGQVLVVEDNPVNRKVIAALLDKLGVSVTSAENGQQAVDAILRGDTPDVILMDIHMPILDGYGATERIRRWEAENARPPRPIIALTADAFAEDRDRCMAAGMDHFLTKPIVFDALKSALAKWLCAAEASQPDAPGADKTLDVPRFLAFVDQIVPLLAQNKFDAFARFQELQALVAGTGIEAEINEIGVVLQAFRYDRALEHLRRVAAIQSKKDLA